MIASLDMLYALKHIYKAKIVVFARNNTFSLLKNLKFVDYIEILENQTKQEKLEKINWYNLDYIISYKANTFLIELFIESNVKKIITRLKIKSFFSIKCKCVWIRLIRCFYGKKTERDRLLFYARKINSNIFDKKIKNLEFKTQIQTNVIHKILINDFLRKNEIKNFIILNPFSITSKHTLDIISFLKLAKNIKKNYQNISIVIPTYELVHDNFIDEIHKYDKNLLEEIIVFKNNNDILNLAELISQSKCIISPSTGAIHIATNLKIPSIALYPPKDEIFWPTYNKDYIIITKTQNDLREDEKQEFIEKITKKLKKYI
ncbi:glycosyltransferase family 9 protein [Campylobacter sp. RM16704]|uniref:glycosyltransferase family 9 protein n=1 Tax=Campylobacter sp. RM16704 TaxID=1500960 RepID=UPI0005806B67|nr:glycosyltransferase family 9 protein [Campylobacter sp. RM16704]AJC85539.1 putative glycosyltransferase, family 9 [Campylobacter sp. RM16704]